MQAAQWGGIAAVALLYAAFMFVGWRGARRAQGRSIADLLIAGRAMPFWMATLTMAATWIDGGYLLGTAEGVFASIPSAWQGGVCFGLSLVLGGAIFARRMRRLEYVTLIDPFTARFGPAWSSVLALPALLGEVLWSAELLVAIGATLGVMLGINLVTAIVVSCAVVTAYTIWGGMWSIGYTDVVQFALIPLGLFVALPFALDAAGGLTIAWDAYTSARPEAARLFPPVVVDNYWTAGRVMQWWDLAIMLVAGGIPWNCYFQRVQSCQTPARAAWHSVAAGVITIVMTVPPLLLGLAAFSFPHWSGEAAAELQATPAMALPLLLAQAVPPIVGILGLAAIVGAVTSSFSASIMSAGSMVGWNYGQQLLATDISERNLKRLVRASILVLSCLAVLLALRVQSVQQLWFFTSDLVFVLLFPQLIFALFDTKANRTGSIVAFLLSLVLRLGGGEAIFAIPAFIPYDDIVAAIWPGFESTTSTYGLVAVFPVRTFAAMVGMIALPLVSRLTARWDPPRPIGNPALDRSH